MSLALGACAKISEGETWQLNDVEVMSVSQKPPACGILYTLVEMEVSGKDGRKDTIFLPCVDVINGPLPSVGKICDAYGTWDIIEGSTSIRSLHDYPPQKLTYELVCGETKYIFNL